MQASREFAYFSFPFLTRQPCVFRTVGLSDFGVSSLQRLRLTKYLRTLAEDDACLTLEGKGVGLSAADLTETLWERGLYVPARLFTSATLTADVMIF